MAGGENSEVIQYFSAAVSIVCAVTGLVVYGTNSNWRRRHYLHAEQSLSRCGAALCILLMYIVTDEVFQVWLVAFYLILVLATVWGTFHSVLLGYVHIVLSSPTLTNEEPLLLKSWTLIAVMSCGILYYIKYILTLNMVDAETVAAIMLLGIETGSLILQTRTFKEAIVICRVNIFLLYFVNFLGIFCDFLLILYGGLCIYSVSIQEINDVLLVVYTGAVLLQSVLVMYCNNQLDWKKFAPRTDEIQL
ncbi:unnamed protein product [Spodoptera littoralis]|uniref:Uncharacterized protein n=1 Tax=Spodoptera littoralis TaxID=7109 RepID=A0A9P0HYV5_SPOLI|nr:unnamed protein product [Spodoptera littoralis]CAH1636713.1 unnamed protein product [Spodoptera littoralis]